MGSPHLVESGHTVAGMEANNTFSNGCDIAGDVIAMVPWFGVGGPVLGELPVLGVGSGYDSSNEKLARLWIRHRDVANLDTELFIKEGCLHFEF